MNITTLIQQLGCQYSQPLFVTGISIDSRKVLPGHLFIALPGEKFDGHHFIAEAQAKGAIAILCERQIDGINIPQFVVKNTLQAMTTMAKLHRKSINCPVIALTGSNGKTSVKEMIASILTKPAHATPGNLNNHIGVPLSVLQLKPEHRYAVFELGANHIGEIAHTVQIVQPQVTLINNIAPAHIEGFGSIEGVARAKGEIYAGLTDKGTAVVNDDDDYAHFWDNLLADKQTIRFSLTKQANVYAKNFLLNEAGFASFTLVTSSAESDITLQVPGEHMARNALAAASCCLAVGISLEEIIRGLQNFKGVSGRLTYLQGKNESLVIDDTYNANLRSVLTAVEVLAKRQGRRILVLGDLGELGMWTQQHHEEIGYAAQRKGIDLLLTCGKHSVFSSKAFGSSARHYASQEELTKDLLAWLDKDTTVLVKGSRSASMEKIVHELVG
ncbi:UDP-N-acetylmuramoyl-tripeptide--D-alanyl-D-alanine ligase [Legionella busanensis]|uniref:UDP-N-acetylmuramoyl-tripeptide--D-alanyl-D-alanine ligase n=1 Tax=Legionella busanensis TaxID=190655 RepID=A0A378JN53_9GAMM|nr:UDP-N-acetylmuramoyl-tripeptide--D-alanyl-D-alanine ligase [Legionella busanensis]STX52684.1 UDP-N-acetylmuramoyl-tripeptide--D-alanyl-D-alanine ligase [Legionella busanensis]